MSVTSLEYTANVHAEDDGTYWAEVAELPGCFASGHDLDELEEGLVEAIELYLDGGAHDATKPPVTSARCGS